MPAANHMEQYKSINQLEPFLALSKSATSPRAAADLVTRVTSHPNTYLVAELLSTPSIRALAQDAEYAPHHRLLEIFSYGTYDDYRSTPGLPALNETQLCKLRKLSLLTLARDRANLSYDALKTALGLESDRDLEDLVMQAVYSGLMVGTLDPSRATVQITSISALRDVRPEAIPEMTAALDSMARRCEESVAQLEGMLRDLRAGAAQRERSKKTSKSKMDAAVREWTEQEKKKGPAADESFPRRAVNKRTMPMETAGAPSEESMDLDEPHGPDAEKVRASKRKM